jgi:putative ABC transport system permease protein
MADYPESAHRRVQYDAGRFINERDIGSRKVIVIGKRCASIVRARWIRSASTSRSVCLLPGRRHHAHVAPTQGDRDANTIFVPFTTLKTAFNMGNRVGFFAMTAKPGTDGPELERQVRDVLGRHHRIAPDDELAIGSFNMFVMFGKFQMFFLVLQLVSWIVGGATLLAGVVGVSNIMLITVKERTKEIGVRKALGATPFSIISMVMKESVVLTAIAGLAGIAAGVGLLVFAEFVIGMVPDSPLGPPNVSLGTVMKAVAVLVGSGALAGIMPASHAASIKPIEALRAE